MTSKDWCDLSSTGSTRTWPRNGVAPSPFHGGRPAALRSMLPQGDQHMIRIDVAHTYAIAGWGKDQLASLIVLFAVRCGLWGAGVFEEQLNMAYDAFSHWCFANKKTSTILEFSKKELKITSLLDAFFLSKNCMFSFSCMISTFFI